jgi:hypothetical protein
MRTATTRAAALIAAAIIATTGIGAAILATGSNEPTPAPAPASTSSTTAPATTEAAALACDNLVGRPTAQIVAVGQCTLPDGTIQPLRFAFYNCTDGRILDWNELGWGYSDGPWQVHARPDGQLIPPDEETARCTAPR